MAGELSAELLLSVLPVSSLSLSLPLPPSPPSSSEDDSSSMTSGTGRRGGSCTLDPCVDGGASDAAVAVPDAAAVTVAAPP
jgi:hypothetical protein